MDGSTPSSRATASRPAGTAAQLDDSSGAAERLDFLAREQQRVSAELEPDARLIYALWGAAWLVGFSALWTAAADGPIALSTPVGGVILLLTLASAGIATTVHVVRRTRGVTGVSSRAGAMYGFAWLFAFACLTVVMVSARGLLSDEAESLLWTALSGLVVGALYLAGGALWHDRVQYGIGLWVLLAATAGAVAGYPAIYLVMALAGGGGFLLTALVLTALGRRA